VEIQGSFVEILGFLEEIYIYTELFVEIQGPVVRIQESLG